MQRRFAARSLLGEFDLRHRNEDPQLSAVPVVLVTNAEPHERPTVGVSDVVRKPIDIDEILFAIKRYCT